MIRHAAAAAFPVGPLPVAVIEPSLPALLVPPLGGSQLLPPCFPPASVAAVSVAPVTMTADPEHRATADTPAKPLAQGYCQVEQNLPVLRKDSAGSETDNQ